MGRDSDGDVADGLHVSWLGAGNREPEVIASVRPVRSVPYVRLVCPVRLSFLSVQFVLSQPNARRSQLPYVLTSR